MPKLTGFRPSKYGIIVAALVAAAIGCRVLGKNDNYSTFFGMLRTFIYIGLYVCWGVAFSKRIIQKPIKRRLLLIITLIIFWFTVRSIKYFFTVNPWLSRHLWYCYYIPMLLIPLLSLYIALMIGKKEGCELPTWAKVIAVPVILIVLFVLTNDKHQWVFSFPPGELWSDKDNGYELGYYIALVTEIVLAISAFGIMLSKSRKAQRGRYLPLYIIVFAAIHGILYSKRIAFVQTLGGDITAAMCLLYVLILEACIQNGLLKSNTGYKSIFEINTLGAQIVDNEYNSIYSSEKTVDVSKSVMMETEKKPVIIDDYILLKSNKIHGGSVIWNEDITEIAEIHKHLVDSNAILEARNSVSEEAYRNELNINSVREKKRLYDNLQLDISRQVARLDVLLEQYKIETDKDAARWILAKICVLGAYIKRRGNLTFLGEKPDNTRMTELEACLEESFKALRYLDVECAADLPSYETIKVEMVIRLYEIFESAIEKSIDSLSAVWVKGKAITDEIVFRIELECESDLSFLDRNVDSCDFEDGVWCLSVRFERMGDEQC